MKKGVSSKSGIVLAIIGVVMMAFGIYREENADILTKAITVCLECIGIG